jgi:hypothetical protein
MAEENSQDPLPVLPTSHFDLQYAPTQRGGARPIAVMVGGLTTSLLAILLSYVLTNKRGDSITDWTVYFLVPLGAFAIGLLAGSGYAITSWITGARLRTALEITMVCLLLLTYVGIQYVEWRKIDLFYVATGQPVGLWDYYRISTPTLVWHSYGTTTHLIGVGFLRRLFEILGFLLGGIIPLASLSRIPYCQLCRLFMTQRVLAYLPASPPSRKIAKMNAQELSEYRQELADMMAAAVEGADQLAELAESGNATPFKEFITSAKSLQRATNKLPSKLEVKLISCWRCRTATLQLSMHIGRTRRHLSTTDLSHDFLAGLTNTH